MSDIVITFTKDVLKIFDYKNDPRIRDSNLIHGNDKGLLILMSQTVWVFFVILDSLSFLFLLASKEDNIYILAHGVKLNPGHRLTSSISNPSCWLL